MFVNEQRNFLKQDIAKMFSQNSMTIIILVSYPTTFTWETCLSSSFNDFTLEKKGKNSESKEKYKQFTTFRKVRFTESDMTKSRELYKHVL